MPVCTQPEPTSVIAGDTVRWVRNLPEYPADTGWQLVYTFINPTHKFVLEASSDGATHQVNNTAAATASWTPGSYAWRAQVKRADEAYTVAQGQMVVRPAYGSVSTLDTRGPARQALDAVEAYLRDPGNIQAQNYSLLGRTLARYSVPELWQHRDRLFMEAQKEEQAAGAATALKSRRVYVRFGA